jgi:xanthine dehydrogenase molybdopterin-binding subunit B
MFYSSNSCATVYWADKRNMERNAMFRVKVYWNYAGVASEAITLTSEVFPSEASAQVVLEGMTEVLRPTITGGDIEAFVQGIGWVVAGDAEMVSESALIGNARRYLDDTGCP